MRGRVFFDTNVLVYADDRGSGKKSSVAQALIADALRSNQGVVSTQVLQEFFVISTRKLGVPAEMARRKVELLARLDVVVVQIDLILGGIDLHRLHGLSFWDALIVRAASSAGCARLLTEDLQHGQVIDGVRVENPFAA